MKDTNYDLPEKIEVKIIWESITQGDVEDSFVSQPPDYYVRVSLCPFESYQSNLRCLNFYEFPVFSRLMIKGKTSTVGSKESFSASFLNKVAKKNWGRRLSKKDELRFQHYERDPGKDVNLRFDYLSISDLSKEKTFVTIEDFDTDTKARMSVTLVGTEKVAKKVGPFSKNGYRIEPIPRPVNRVSLGILKSSQAKFFDKKDMNLPPTEVIQKHAFTETQFGIRPIKNRDDLNKYIREGDIIVFYNPLHENSTPLELFHQGQWHAAMALKNTKDPFNPKKLLFPEYPEGYMCHVDASNYYSGCDFFQNEGPQKKPGHFHFFRVDHKTDDSFFTVREMIRRVKGRLKYDIQMKLDVMESENRQKVRQAIFDGRISEFKQYCSEVPYTIHTLASGSPVMTPLDMNTVMFGFNKLVSSGKFVNALDPYELSEELAFALARGYQLLGLELSKTKLNIVKQSTAAYLVDSKISTLKKYATSWYAGVKMPPLSYMHHAKKPSRVHYVGSIEDLSYPPKPIYKAKE